MTDTNAPRLSADLARAITEHELNKYLQLLRTDTRLQTVNDTPFTYALPEFDPLRDALTTNAELVIARLAVQGAFVVLTDGNFERFLAGGKGPHSSDGDDAQVKDASWLGAIDSDVAIWRSLFQRTLSVNGSLVTPRDKVCNVTSMGDIDPSHQLSSVAGTPHLSFYAGTPIISKHGINIGIVFVVDRSIRKELSSRESHFLTSAAKKCMQLLEFARERDFGDRLTLVNSQLDRFVRSRDVLIQVPKEPRAPKVEIGPRPEKTELQQVRDIARRFHGDSNMVDDLFASKDDLGKDSESTRLLEVEEARDDRLAREDDEHNASAPEGPPDNKEVPEDSKGETTYCNVFRRAAECLQAGLHVDGVMFSDGVIGCHGSVQPVAEPEQELEPEGKHEGERAKNNSTTQAKISGEAMRVYTSAEYQKGVHVDRPAEILGMHTRKRELGPATTTVSESTLGMVDIDEGYLQRLMDRHPEGNVWYFPAEITTSYLVKDDTLCKNDSQEETRRLSSSFPGIKQLIFQPLIDSVSLKRLAGCFIWSMQTWPILTDSVELFALKGFLYIVQAEVSRIDTVTAMKQKETFVSSISHELRTPLHGILGAVQLLGDTSLDHFQKVLTSTIKSCGSTLHETLSSVLSYAKINQFERRQDRYGQRRPPDSPRVLTDRHSMAAGPDRDFAGLYIVNIAMLCEEIVRMLEAGLVFSMSKRPYTIVVILNIRYEDNWCFYTEPGALRRIAANIIGNALKYTPHGSVTVTLTTSEEIGNGRVLNNDGFSGRIVNLTVTDTGKGMSNDFVEHHLFVPFTQEDANTSEGVDLGMSIVKNLVSLLSGEIFVKSNVGKGTEIRVSMPMRRTTEDQDELERPALEFAQDIEYLRSIHLSVVVFGFPGAVRDSVESYLLEWFQCTMLDITDDRNPDVIIIEEGNTEAREAIEKSASRYGHQGVLLSIVMEPPRLGKKMEEIEGYPQCELLPRPLGPHYLSRALISCMNKLKQLRAGNTPAKDGKCQQDEYVKGKENGQKDEGSASEESNQGSSPPDERIQPPRSAPSQSRAQQEEVNPCGEGAWDGQTSNRSSELRILIVDDNDLNRRLLGAFLKKYGCRNIQKAENGAVAVEAVKNHLKCFDIIFMDLSMPVMDGFEATRETRSIEKKRCFSRQTAEAPSPAVIVALTGLASDREVEKPYAAGVDFFLTKPVRFESLEYLLKKYEDGTLWSSDHRSG
ncbi:hypothetical protein PMIN02_012435 [Paraphaeosphaeria minitans]